VIPTGGISGLHQRPKRLFPAFVFFAQFFLLWGLHPFASFFIEFGLGNTTAKTTGSVPDCFLSFFL
jgi:hypothetical protein